MPRPRPSRVRATRATAPAQKQPRRRLAKRPRRQASDADALHALVGGWTQHRGKFLSLLLGVRTGRRRKLTYVGEVGIPPDRLMATILEDQLRMTEVEINPFDTELAERGNATRHWVAPELVAELENADEATALKHGALAAVAPRSSFRKFNWVTPQAVRRSSDPA